MPTASECFELYGDLCRDLCACHGGVAVVAMAEATACAELVDDTTYECGCLCTLP